MNKFRNPVRVSNATIDADISDNYFMIIVKETLETGERETTYYFNRGDGEYDGFSWPSENGIKRISRVK